MQKSTPSAHSLASSFAEGQADVVEELRPAFEEVVNVVERFMSQPPTPQGTYQFEQDLANGLREVGRVAMERSLNRIESGSPDLCPPRVRFVGEEYRRRRQHPNRIGTLFGVIVLWRFLYEPLERGERSIHPLEIHLGIEAGVATPALADRVGWWTASNSERVTLEIIAQEHGVQWSKKTLRKLTSSLSAGMASHQHEAQVAKILAWLKEAQKSRGRGRPVLSVGRDGIHTPIRGSGYHEGAVATITVHDRRGKRLGTVYLACMPEPGQVTLSAQLTRLIDEVLQQWEGPLARLAYVTDDGYHPRQYYHRVLRRMEDPRRPGTFLVWTRVVDYFHACEYITELAEALFGATEGHRWARKMRLILKTRSNGIVLVLKSAAALRYRRKLSRREQAQYFKAYRYLRNRRQWMQYHTYRRQHLPIGSGVTEAACKTVFTQRLKQSGMSWKLTGGQVVLNLRVVLLSQTWRQVHTAYLNSKVLPKTSTNTSRPRKRFNIAA